MSSVVFRTDTVDNVRVPKHYDIEIDENRCNTAICFPGCFFLLRNPEEMIQMNTCIFKTMLISVLLIYRLSGPLPIPMKKLVKVPSPLS